MKYLIVGTLLLAGLSMSHLTQAASSDTSTALVGGYVTADLGHDGIAETIVGAAPGSTPTISVYRPDNSLIGSFLAYDAGFMGGVNVAVCDVDGDGVNEIISGTHFGGGPQVRIFDNLGQLKYAGFFAYATDFRGGVNVACGDIDNDGIANIVTGAGLTGGPHVKVFDPQGHLKSEFFSGDVTLNTGAYVTVSNGVITAEPMTSASTMIPSNVYHDRQHDDVAQYIHVDLSEQKLTAYAYGVPQNSFLVSTGVASHPTPIGSTDVKAKLLWHDYNWFYGVDNPNNYSLPNVKYNLRIYDHIYIHYAYWHNNFGHVMSHGCINVNYTNSEWIYNWANVGATVDITQ